MKVLDESSSIEEVAATVSHACTAAGITGSLGFTRHRGRHFTHPTCPYTVEFPPWPLAIGRELIREWTERRVGLLSIQILTPTQCVMDRLAAFYHWRDRQALDQAVAVAAAHDIDLKEIQRWSAAEGQDTLYVEFHTALARGLA